MRLAFPELGIASVEMSRANDAVAKIRTREDASICCYWGASERAATEEARNGGWRAPRRTGEGIKIGRREW